MVVAHELTHLQSLDDYVKRRWHSIKENWHLENIRLELAEQPRVRNQEAEQLCWSWTKLYCNEGGK